MSERSLMMMAILSMDLMVATAQGLQT
jgi:hypothetical protein